MRRILSALKLLLKSPAYLLLALTFAALLFAVYFVVNDLSLFRSAAGINPGLPFLWKVFSNQVSMIFQISGPAHVLSIGLVAVLGGINFTLTVLRVRRTGVLVGRSSLAGILGTFGGAFSASCAACSTALISLLGLSGGLAILPFGGLEVSLLAIALLLISLYYIAKSLGEFGIVSNG